MNRIIYDNSNIKYDSVSIDIKFNQYCLRVSQDTESVCVNLSKQEFLEFAKKINEEVERIETEEIDTRIVSMTGYELAARFIGELEHAGFNPYMFNEGQADYSDVFELNHQRCIALGMSEIEFNGRSQNG